jgi:cell shape-determining protein MreC
MEDNFGRYGLNLFFFDRYKNKMDTIINKVNNITDHSIELLTKYNNELDNLEKENEELKRANDELKKENDKLKKANDELRKTEYDEFLTF